MSLSGVSPSYLPSCATPSQVGVIPFPTLLLPDKGKIGAMWCIATESKFSATQHKEDKFLCNAKKEVFIKFFEDFKRAEWLKMQRKRSKQFF
jgi:hypothetical protein